MKKIWSMSVGIAVALVLFVPARAFDKSSFKTQAASSAKQIRAAGEPKDRCFLNATFADGAIVTRRVGIGPLEPGDDLISVDAQPVEGASADKISDILRGIPPDKTIIVRIERDGTQQDLQVACTNSRPTYELILSGLDQASKGKFDECVATFGSVPNPTSYEFALRSECASYSKKPQNYPIGKYSHDALEAMIGVAKFDPTIRRETAQILVRNRPLIEQTMSPGKYQRLADMTKEWPGSDDLLSSVEPDYRQFRQNGEAAVKVGLFDPMSAVIEWPYGFTYGTWKPFLSKRVEGYWTCGRINAKNRMGGYVGSTAFVVVLSQSGSVLFSQVGTNDNFDLLSASCNNSIAMLPPPQAAMIASGTPSSNSSSSALPSLADELTKLAELKAAGALTDAEFEAAKKRLLEAPQ